jgi:hypothetical protein
MIIEVADAHAQVQRLVSVVKMSTVFEECATKSGVLVSKMTQCKDIHKEIIPVYGVKCLSSKRVHTWIEKRGKAFADEKRCGSG